MPTTIGHETDIGKLVTNLIYLEHDAIAAYDATIEGLESAGPQQQVAQFRDDHRQHLSVLNEMAREIGIDAPQEGDTKQMLTTGKVKLAGLIGDGAILKAMKTNEDETVTAYERASGHPRAVEKSKAFFVKALGDEKRHRSWMEQAGAELDASR